MQIAKRTAQQFRQCHNKCSVVHACVLLVTALAAIMTAAPSQAQDAKKTTAHKPTTTAELPVTVEYGANRLPVNVAEMREAILAAAAEIGADLIVMGTHGHGTLADVMMGSTARRVLRRSKKPVLVVRLPEEES